MRPVRNPKLPSAVKLKYSTKQVELVLRMVGVSGPRRSQALMADLSTHRRFGIWQTPCAPFATVNRSDLQTWYTLPNK
jgi:hypothetical protein